MKVYQYQITLRHDKGRINIVTVATTKETAIRMVCAAERAPESAVVASKMLRRIA